ncbi:complex I NDUFA9 subunit family protein [Robbsia andropogonis]|uniref:complex I NDUFA9 subunit family protein n=1 Tax=Robbsia andropogonis TaxID=28092 RepID=UPI00046730E6|nr:complex I NDUFA9 subunit family protein [Robbsia andropogonis]MCP1117712.1 complex I NDUFA9 subunit family protein [Robbsia andropogonis]MCP1127178.1 complex I NDUFA9 subunit family protein [Robbsia andropogonis]
MRYQTVAVIGGTGFIGRSLIPKLLTLGYAVRVATRYRTRARPIQMLPISITECDVHAPAQLSAFLDGADVVINLVGVLQDKRAMPYGPGFERAHVALPEKICTASRALGIERFLHVSALHADSNGPSMYLRSKGDGEQRINAAVAASQAEGGAPFRATIFRPSVIFGPGDQFLNLFAQVLKFAPFMPLACAHARYQPIYVEDVAQALVNAIELDAPTVPRVFELGGPHVYTLAELVRFAGEASGHRRPVIGLPDWAGHLQGAIFEHLPNPPITRDNIDSMREDSVLSGPLDPLLRLTPASLESVAGAYLRGLPVGQRWTPSA